MDAVITAGGIPGPEDALYQYTQGNSKAMLEIAGKPMVQWVMDAVCTSEHIDQIVIIGLEPDSKLNCTKPITYIPNQGSMLDNVRGGIFKVAEINPEADQADIEAAIRALSTVGIQRGHMRLHARQVAMAAGANDDQVQRIANQLVAEKQINTERAKELLADMN